MADVIFPHELRDGAGNVASGAEVMRNLNALKAVLENLDTDNLTAVVQEMLFTTGDIRPWIFRTAPSGWLLVDRPGMAATAAHPRLRQKLIDDGSPWGLSGADPLLPPLPGRVAVGAGTGTGLTRRDLGQLLGEETHRLTTAEMPIHTHTYRELNTAIGGRLSGGNAFPHVDPTPTSAAGGDAPHNTMQPSVVLNYVVKT